MAEQSKLEALGCDTRLTLSRASFHTSAGCPETHPADCTDGAVLPCLFHQAQVVPKTQQSGNGVALEESLAVQSAQRGGPEMRLCEWLLFCTALILLPSRQLSTKIRAGNPHVDWWNSVGTRSVPSGTYTEAEVWEIFKLPL